MYTTKRDERKKKIYSSPFRLTTESCTPKTITGGLRIWVLSERKETTLFCRSSSRQKLNQGNLNRRGHESGKDGGGKDFRGGGSAFELTNVEGRGRGEMLDSSTGSVGQRKRSTIQSTEISTFACRTSLRTLRKRELAGRWWKRKGRREERKVEELTLSKRVWKKKKGREKRRIKEARQRKRIAAAYSH
ncbi:uncharacterized protein ASPGLDRAFT_343994 [Aspergillus glaucus CBS 516.65]|uniref:Uncharacterized protein n=1 Tax=Aspergillus glaucus CBS 516.65 TaxID=1160497 RepID=A0A1L9VIP5_ASPGL|nr:hypothetical protein ASPGLDRAFT_343994 [Aspergillus glaucus CBS 516.65]OJJ83796.1 hypothetical protein ASPGLDRAFT_343994 [Aspergillus glaucus CBS 516.65]